MEPSDKLNTPFMKRAIERYSLPKDQWETIDHIIFDHHDYFNKDYEKIVGLRHKAIMESLHFHYNNSHFYKHLCKEYGMTPEDIKSPADYDKIPMLPDTFFKEYPEEKPEVVFDWLQKITTVDMGKYTYKGKDLQGFLRWAEHQSNGLINHSSGTTGNYGILYRDETTFHRFYYGIVYTAAQRVPIHNEPYYICPSSPNTYLTIGRWTAELGNMFKEDHRFFLTGREITMRISRLIATGTPKGFKDKLILNALHKSMAKGEKKLISVLQDLEKKGEQIILLSTPYQLYSMMQRMSDNGISLDLSKSDGVVLTGGGWKIFENQKVPFNEFAQRVQEVLGVEKESFIDVYGMSEMNGVALTCKGEHKHLVPWIHPLVLDDRSGVLDYDEWGRFAFLDPAAHSYPGYIITGDRVRLLERCPHCDLPGPVIDGDITRMQGSEAKGCANLMRGMMAEELHKIESRRKGIS